MSRNALGPIVRLVSRLAVLAVLGPIVIVGGLGGCTAWATYPPIPGAVDLSDPTLAPIPELMAAGVLAAHGPLPPLESDDAVEIVFNLPPDTPISAYRSVRRRIPGSRWMEPGDAAAAFHVHQVRLRMFDAEVDIIFSPLGGGGAAQMTTFAFKNKAGWKLERRRDWGMRVRVPDAQTPMPPGGWPSDPRPAEPAPVTETAQVVDENAG